MTGLSTGILWEMIKCVCDIHRSQVDVKIRSDKEVTILLREDCILELKVGGRRQGHAFGEEIVSHWQPDLLNYVPDDVQKTFKQGNVTNRGVDNTPGRQI